MRILLVDEDRNLINQLQISLGEYNYVLDAVTDGEQGWIYGSTYTYDLIILDWSLPQLDGISLCQRFRNDGYHLPILLLSAPNSIADKIRGLDAGADDCLDKPFQIQELTARIRALLRRASNSFATLNWGDLQLELNSCQVTYRGQILLLTAKEYGLLELFLRHTHKIFSVEEIIQNLWTSVEYPTEATVRSHLRRLRLKLKLAGLAEDPIATVRGRGYCLKSFPENNHHQVTSSTVQLKAQDRKRGLHLAALNSAWQKYQLKSEQQLAFLQSALKALKEGTLTPNDCQRAKSIAHSLAGNLGLFGFELGSELARELEQLLPTNLISEPLPVVQFETILDALRQELAVNENISAPISDRLTADSPLLLIINNNDPKFSEQLTQEANSQGIQTAILPSPQQASNWLETRQPGQFPYAAILKIPFAKLAFHPTTLWQYLALIAEFKLQTPSIPVLVIADRDRLQDRLLVARHGPCLYLKQPVTPRQALSFCQQFLDNCPRDKKIMILDDDVELLQVLTSLLKPWQFQLTTLDNPRQFWDVLEAVHPHLLILDIEMPYLSGIELYRVLQTHPYWCKLPVLFLSVHTDVTIREQVLNLGANDLLNKPVTAKQLADRILNRLKSVISRTG